MTVRMLLRKVKLENLLSFRKTEVELRGLNVLIGANASGKSNLIEAIGLLQAAPVDLNTAIRRLGGVRVVCSLARSQYSPIAAIECKEINDEPLRYRLEFSEASRGFVILRERLSGLASSSTNGDADVYFERSHGTVHFGSSLSEISTIESVLQRSKSLADTTPITRIGQKLEEIRIYREFRTTSDSQVRMGAGVSSPPAWDKLYDGGGNLAVVLWELGLRELHERVRSYLRRFCDRFNDVEIRLDEAGIAQTYIEESGLLETLVSWRLSDGTLKFLCLLAVLLDPDPAPLICIEEPEVGLHPEAIQIVADALVEASERTQLIVTTHSEALIDALSERPEDVLITERDADNSTQFRRLDKQQLSLWLEDYSLGRLWRMGEIGGTRW
jgi:predicted ATPase